MSGYIKIAIAAIIWGSIGTVARLVHMPVPVMTFYRVFFAAIAILTYIIAQRKLGELKIGRHVPRIVLMGLLLAANWTAFFYSVRLTSIANAVLITYTAPIYVAILAPVFLKERLERITVLTLLVALVGAVLIASPSAGGFSSGDVAGLLWAFVSSLTYAALVLLTKPITATVSALAIIFYEELTCSVALSPALLFYSIKTSPGEIALLFVIGVVHTVIAALFYLSGLRDVKAQQAGIFTYLDPASAVVFAALILGEIPKTTTLIGGALVIISGVILVIATRERVPAEIISE